MDDAFPIWSNPPEDTITGVFARATAADPDKQFLDFLGKTFSYAELDRKARQAANGLVANGVAKGDTVVCLLDNSDEFVALWLGMMRIGAICVPVNTGYKGEYLRHQIADSGAALVVAEHDYAERIASLCDNLPELATIAHRGPAPADAKGKRLLPFEALFSEDDSEPGIEIHPEDLAFLIYTGGTTGPSKGCMISHNYAVTLAKQLVIGSGRKQHCVSWSALPMFHFNIYTNTLLACALVGASVAIYPRFSVSKFWPELERTGATDVSLIGAMFPMLLNAPENEAEKRYAHRLEAVMGAPFTGKTMAAWAERFGTRNRYCPGYGFTEATMLTLVSAEDAHLAPPDSSGRRNAWFDTRIVDDHGVEVADGLPGEIIARPRMPNIMFSGYWRRPEDTLKIMKNMWLHTGDIGRFDEQGWFYFVDRKKDYLRRRGENISSFEVENVLRSHAAIDDVAAHAVPSPLGEDDLKITAVLKTGEELRPETLFEWCVDRLPYFALPRYIEFRADLPKSPVGRVLKYELRDQGVTAGTWDFESSGITVAKR
ncbi:AMP-binding protein [Tardibacter chloracetimidivorans]|uniref:AMP-binding protein n=1 Tax=Tardibacter chloracetimidivorans TaxID=1921510 RepID=UPI000AA7CA94|nr:AMP-binding protein [Tardibacter chloracetimidivorans]